MHVNTCLVLHFFEKTVEMVRKDIWCGSKTVVLYRFVAGLAAERLWVATKWGGIAITTVYV